MMPRWLFLVISGLFGGACSEVQPAEVTLFSVADDVERVVSDATFDTVWVLGGPGDTLLASPTFPRPHGDGGVVFFDLQQQRVYRVAADGHLAWTWGRKGEGPGEFRNVRGLDVAPNGNVVLSDSGNRRLITLSPAGELISEDVLRVAGFVSGVSVLADDRLAIHTSRMPWGVWDGDDEHPADGLPPGLWEMSDLQNQGRLTAWRGDSWVFGFTVGNGWMVFKNASVVGVYPYVEHYDFPEVAVSRRAFTTSSRMVRHTPSTGRSVSVRGDTLYVLFGGASSMRGYMMDTYEIATGRYLQTHLLPHHANRAVVDAAGRVFTVSSNSATLFPTVVALTPRQSGG